MTAALEGSEWSAARLGRTTPGKDPIPILQEAGWAPGPVWTVGKSRPHWDSIPDRPAHSQSLYRPSYPTHTDKTNKNKYTQTKEYTKHSTNNTKHSKYKCAYYQKTHTIITHTVTTYAHLQTSRYFSYLLGEIFVCYKR